jgi:hypothetical protein
LGRDLVDQGRLDRDPLDQGLADQEARAGQDPADSAGTLDRHYTVGTASAVIAPLRLSR